MTFSPSDERRTFRAAELPDVEIRFRVPGAWESWFLGFIAGCAVFVATFGVQWLIYGYLLGHEDIHLIGISVASILTFTFVQRMMAASRQRRLATQRRLALVVEMNHHIRNSLQTILYQSYTLDDDVATRLKDAVDRIQWVLERVLPDVYDDGGKRRKSPDDESERAA
jgi:signal transduction histidine kinase